MRRVLSLSFPGFAVQRLRSGTGANDRTLVVAVTRGSQWVAERSPAAAALGVERGMGLAHARALLGGRAVTEVPFDPHGDRLVLRELGEWALRFSPLVALDPPAGLFLDVAGTERLFGGAEETLAVVAAAFEAEGYPTRAAVADTVGCAWAVARFGERERTWVRPGDERAALAPLPIAALRIEAETIRALVEVGIERIEHLFALSRDELPSRFDAELLLRLDQALGRAFESLELLRPLPPLERARAFEEPVGPGVVQNVARILLRELTDELRRRGEGARKLVLELLCAEASPAYEEVVLSRPSQTDAHLWSLLEPKLERVQLGFGAEHLRLGMPVTAPLEQRQTNAWLGPAPRAGSSAKTDKALGELLDTLAARLGRERILALEAVESHLPERAFRTRSGLEPAAGKSASRVSPLARPTRLFTPPESIDVETEPADTGEQPVRFRWRGRVFEVLRRIGPERVESPWWKDERAPSARDYFCVQEEGGRWLWIVRGGAARAPGDARARWFVHGEWT